LGTSLSNTYLAVIILLEKFGGGGVTSLNSEKDGENISISNPHIIE